MEPNSETLCINEQKMKIWIGEDKTDFFTKQGRPKKNLLWFEAKPVMVLEQTCYGFEANQL